MIWRISILLFFSVSCGVKGAPAPRQNSAYIFDSKGLNETPSTDRSTNDEKNSSKSNVNKIYK